MSKKRDGLLHLFCVQEHAIQQSISSNYHFTFLLPHSHLHYLILIETLLDSCFGKYQSSCIHMCMIKLVKYKNNVLWCSVLYTHNYLCISICFRQITFLTQDRHKTSKSLLFDFLIGSPLHIDTDDR